MDTIQELYYTKAARSARTTLPLELQPVIMTVEVESMVLVHAKRQTDRSSGSSVRQYVYTKGQECVAHELA